MSIYNWGFNNFYINSFAPMPFWSGCGCNSFSSGFRFGIFNSLFNNFMPPQMNMFAFPQTYSMPFFTPYNNIFALQNRFVMPSYNMFNPIFNYSVPALGTQLNTFNNYTKSFINQQSKTNFNTITTTRNQTNRRSIIPNRIDNSFQNSQKLDKNFLNKVKEVARNLNCDYKDLLAVMNSESGLRTTARNGNTAVGLIQFTNSSIAELNQKYGMNLTKNKIASMTPIQQLDLAEKYLKSAKSYKFPPNAKLSAADLYAITFLPGRADKEILCRSGEAYYEHNKGLDKNRDGVITKSDLAYHLSGKHINERLFA